MKLVLINFEVHPGGQVCCDTTMCKSNNLGPFTLDKLLSWCKIKTNVRSFIRIKEFALNSTIVQSDLIRRRILRIHSTFLFFLTIAATLNTMVGWSSGKGLYALWHEQQFAALGLFQAYLLMFVVGIVLWLGSNQQTDLWKWDLIGLLAHLPPLSVNFNFADLFASYGFQSTSLVSITLHRIWISSELFAILCRGRSAPQRQMVV